MKKWKKPTKDFYMMPNGIFKVGLDPFSFMILSYLIRRMNDDSECWPSISTMHKDLGISVSTIQDRLNYLKKRNLIAVGKCTASGKFKNNVYTVCSIEDPEVYRDLTPPEELPLFIGDELPL